jgi:osmoprotectant transport system permease protein
VIRKETLELHPELASIVDKLGGTISDQEMRELNYAVDGQHQDVKRVARDFLKKKGLVP